ncbi:MAG: cyclopropane-fatty-acyl-phospholipid synthase family protein [Hyphomicrobiales bacterium]
MLLEAILRNLIRKGNLRVTNWQGATSHFGDGSGPLVHVKFNTSRASRLIAFHPDLYVGECYMNGSLELLHGSIYDLLATGFANIQARGSYHWLHEVANTARMITRRVSQQNPVGTAKSNVAHHYDLSGGLYDLFLDKDRQYSCAYFEAANGTLEEAQLAKKRHLAAKLQIEPGMRVLDIGSGWGGLGLYLAEVCGADVTGVTLSEEQHKLSTERARASAASGRLRFLLQDYRSLDQQFDRIVSVGMFEHVGVGHYPEFFSKVRRLLKDDGIAVLHSINRSDGPGFTSAWVRKYIFPGGYIPALSEVMPHLEREGLYVTDVEILRLHYAETLRHWARRFAKNRERAATIYDERFCRMWEFYLAASECAFRFGGMNNSQIQFARNQHVLPLTRDYVSAAEDRLRRLEGKTPMLRKVSG